MTLAAIERMLGAATHARGLDYARRGRVRDILYTGEGSLTACVSGSLDYAQRIDLEVAPDGSIKAIEGDCTCPIMRNCKHVAAVMIEAAQRDLIRLSDAAASPQATPSPPTSPQLPLDLTSWLDHLARIDAATANAPQLDAPSKTKQRLLYVFSEGPSGFSVTPTTLPLRKDGQPGAGAGQVVNTGGLEWRDPPAFLTALDARLINQLEHAGVHRSPRTPRRIMTEPGEVMALLEAVAATGRAVWGAPRGPALAKQAARRGVLRWRGLDDGRQMLELRDADDRRLKVLPIDPPGWIDPDQGGFGQLELDAPPELVRALLAAPPIAPESVEAVTSFFAHLSSGKLPAPRRVDVHVRGDVAPTPVLHLFMATGQREVIQWSRQYGYGPLRAIRTKTNVAIPAVRVAFDYDGRVVAPFPRADIRYLQGDTAVTTPRRHDLEQAALDLLAGLGLVASQDFPGVVVKPPLQADVWVFGGREARLSAEFPEEIEPDEAGAAFGSDDALAFMARGAPRLRSRGWRIEVGDDWPFRINAARVTVNATIEASGTRSDWFAIGLAVVIDGHRLDLAPLVLSIIERLPTDAAGELATGFDVVEFLAAQIFFQRLPDGAFVEIAAETLAPLVEVFLRTRGMLAGFHSGEAGAAKSVADALAGCGVAFDGGQALLDLGAKLNGLAAAPQAEPPVALRATLRPYQKTGFGWLRALADTGFGGVLADDMGLGKTVQTLALLTERHVAQKSDRPSLIIAPTSLVATWSNEAARFAPDLKVLVLHGADRRQRFDMIIDHDLVITTYPLLGRDEATLARQAWDCVILDEAQAAKNPASVAAKSIRRLEARTRLALTGTPMENNLEDLWSLFDWTVPGLLGDRKTFKTLFRGPIEQGADPAAQALLNRRVKPFMLHRTKAQVALDLPAKTEIIESVILGEAQRALYETIRLTMDARVRSAIAAKGLAASRITILDALLKLRQVCCDPLLLPAAAGAGATGSAKRTRLLEMLEALIAEGRRVVVFSQFVGMLRLIEADVRTRGWGYEWLSGTTKDRAGAVERFQRGHAPLFLISLKAGGTGLTLTAADTVILYDPWWNPAVERQAMDRVHRIGQDRPVFIHRLVAQGAVEEAIVKLQEKKQSLADALFEGEASGPLALDSDDLDLLFRPLRPA